ncbi:MAG: hypoxanthine phosphoribosyltransferase [Syntrophomonadaceae bacterium]
MNSAEADLLFSPDELKQKARELAKKISRDFAGEQLLVVGILKGAFIFMADLVREIDLDVQIDFMDVSSYGMSTLSSGEVRINKDLDFPLKDKNVLIVEDIIDSGLTLNYIVEILKKREPKKISICCLLDKPSRRKSSIRPDYVGYTINDDFVVGYGLDYAERYRSCPGIYILKRSVYEK